MNGYISKPVTPQVLVKALERWLPVNDGRSEEQSGDPAGEHEPVFFEQSVAAAVSHSNLTVFDKAGMMARLMDDEELMHIVITGFLADMPLQIMALDKHLQNNDAGAVERQAHTIKGAVANVSGIALGAVALQMETDARAGHLDRVKGHMAELERQFDILKQALSITLQ
jgi:HPt (histidine-containing phosphotransfer) domain-containing protein